MCQCCGDRTKLLKGGSFMVENQPGVPFYAKVVLG